MDNTALITCMQMLLNELHQSFEKPKKTSPVNLVVNSSHYKQIKLNQGGTEYKPYGQSCNEKHFYEGRPVIVRCGTSLRRCLFGVMTNFRKVPYETLKGTAENNGLHLKAYKYKSDAPIAVIDFSLTDMMEYNLESGRPTVQTAVEIASGG